MQTIFYVEIYGKNYEYENSSQYTVTCTLKVKELPGVTFHLSINVVRQTADRLVKAKIAIKVYKQC